MRKIMRLRQLALRSLMHYWRTHLAVAAGVAIAVSVLSGALLVGQSVRASLRSLLYQRLGSTEYVIASDRFFDETLAERLAAGSGNTPSLAACPIIHLQGVVVHEATGMRARNVNVYGVDDRFWKFQAAEVASVIEGRTALVGEALAKRLAAREDDVLLLRIETAQGVPRESLFGRRENVGRTIRLTCGNLLPAEQLGEFSLRPVQGEVYSLFMPLQRLQRDLAQPSRANTLLLAAAPFSLRLERIRELLRANYSLRDVGVTVKALPSRQGILVESSRAILDNAVAEAAAQSAAEAGMKTSGIFTYLANAIRVHNREIPYSVITAANLGEEAMSSIRGIHGPASPITSAARDDSIWLNEWAWKELNAAPGDPAEIDYYLWLEDGRLATQTARFTVAGGVMIGGDVDAALAPDFPGITEAKTIGSWDPPFPLDLRRIRAQDEDYWNQFRATPKAFIALAKGQQLWQSRYGKLTGLRVALPSGVDLITAQQQLSDSLRKRLDPEQTGFFLNAVKQGGLEASRGSTDFGEYFVYFSFFLIAAAILMAALFFRLGVEQRVREIGILRSTGFSPGSIGGLFLREGAILSAVGSVAGLLGAMFYGWMMVLGLRTWWVGAVGTQRLQFHIVWSDLLIGAAVGIGASLGTIAWTLRVLHGNSPRALMAGVLEAPASRHRRTRLHGFLAVAAALAAGSLLLGSAIGRISDTVAFFGAGLLLLLSMLNWTALYLQHRHLRPISGRGWSACFRLGVRNATCRPGRSLLCITLIAAATFILVSVEAFRQDPQSITLDSKSGTGGYPLIAESALPIVYDPNSPEGREAMGIGASEAPEIASLRFVPFRVRAGDDASCLNLYAPREPRILGAPRAFLAAARFSFQNSLASTPEEQRNPWLLLESFPRDGVIPAIGDANTIQYILHLNVGSELVLNPDSGAPVRLKLVAALRGSMLQGALLISEANFLKAFPGIEGYRFFLLDAPMENAASMIQLLEERLADWGISVESSRSRLAAYHRVENTYLSTFQLLGALGLILGTVGLATILLRNVLERRHELALLKAVGFRRRSLAGIILAENMLLMALGLACGTICALLATVPALHARGLPFPAVMAGLILLAVLFVGLASSLLAVRYAFRTPLLPALQSE